DVGPKATNLALMRRFGFPVPDGFCITARAYLQHVKSSPVLASMTQSLEAAEAADSDKGLKRLGLLRTAIVTMPLHSNLQTQIEHAYHRLHSERVAVRSSATAEDLPGHSFAGLYDTFLGVRGISNITQAVKSCWASLWSERAVEYRERKGFDHQAARM